LPKILANFLWIALLHITSGCTEIRSIRRETVKANSSGLTLTSTGGSFAVKASWLTRVNELEYESVFLTFHDPKTGEPIPMEPQLFFDPQMPSMGHGTATEEQTFTFGEESTSVLVKNVFFIMGGDWTITLTGQPVGRDEDTAFIDLFVNPLPAEADDSGISEEELEAPEKEEAPELEGME
jgi:hypothetical protein